MLQAWPATPSRRSAVVDAVGHFRIEVREVGGLDDGRHYSVVSVTVRGEGSGAVVTNDHLHVLRVADDRVAELWQHLDAERARAELGIGAASSRPLGRAT